MKVLLVFPKKEPFSVEKEFLKTYVPVPPLGISYIAAVLRKNNIDVRLIDCHISEPSELKEAIKWAEYVGISVPTIFANDALEIAEYAKQQGKKVLVGGPHATIDPKFFLKTDFVDFVFKNECDYSLLEFLKGNKNVKGLVYKKNGKIIDNGIGKVIENVDELPIPAFDLLPIKRYFKINKGFITMITSRGCPYNCIFCAKEIGGYKYRARSPIKVVDEMQHLIKEYNPHFIFFNDDLFTLNKKRVLEICKLIKEEGIKVSWGCESRVNVMDEEMVKAMKEAGCRNISLGVESGSQKVLDYINKGITVEQTRKVTRLIQKYGIDIHYFIIIGSPVEGWTDVQKTKDLIREMQPTSLSIAIFSPLPGTRAYGELKDRIINKDVVDTDFFNKISFRHDIFSEDDIWKFAEELKSIQKMNKKKNLLRNIFLHPVRFVDRSYKMLRYGKYLNNL